MRPPRLQLCCRADLAALFPLDALEASASSAEDRVTVEPSLT